MKVYCFEPNSSYSGGCIIVAANSPEEALGTIYSSECYFANYTDIKHCKEINELSVINVESPKVILDTLYVE